MVYYDHRKKKYSSKPWYIIMIISSVIATTMGSVSIIKIMNSKEETYENDINGYYEWELQKPLYVGTDDFINWHLTSEHGDYRIIREVNTVSNVVKVDDEYMTKEDYEIINLSGMLLSIPRENTKKLKK